MKQENTKTRGEKGHRSIKSSCQGPWLGGRAGKSLRPRALGHCPARVGNSAVGQVGGCCRLLSQCFDLHGDEGNTRSKFKIYSASCSSLGLRKSERERWVREVSGRAALCRDAEPCGALGQEVTSPGHSRNRELCLRAPRCDLGTMVGDTQGCPWGNLWKGTRFGFFLCGTHWE